MPLKIIPNCHTTFSLPFGKVAVMRIFYKLKQVWKLKQQQSNLKFATNSQCHFFTKERQKGDVSSF
jgi:hypothetical protein